MDEIVLLLQELNENGRHNIIFTLYLSLTFNIKCCSYEILFSIAISVQRLVDCQLLLADERREADREQLRLLAADTIKKYTITTTYHTTTTYNTTTTTTNTTTTTTKNTPVPATIPATTITAPPKQKETKKKKRT